MPDAVRNVLETIEHANERDAGERGENPEAGIEAVLGQRTEMKRRQLEEGARPERGPPDHVRDHRGRDDNTERFGFEIAEDELEGEDDSRDRRIERCGDTGRRTTRDEKAQPGFRNAE